MLVCVYVCVNACVCVYVYVYVYVRMCVCVCICVYYVYMCMLCRQPSQFVNVKLPAKMPPEVPLQTAAQLLRSGHIEAYLQQSVKQDLGKALIKLTKHRDSQPSLKHPRFSTRSSALVLLGLLLKGKRSVYVYVCMCVCQSFNCVCVCVSCVAGNDGAEADSRRQFEERVHVFLKQCLNDSKTSSSPGAGVNAANLVQLFDE